MIYFAVSREKGIYQHFSVTWNIKLIPSYFVTCLVIIWYWMIVIRKGHLFIDEPKVKWALLYWLDFANLQSMHFKFERDKKIFNNGKCSKFFNIVIYYLFIIWLSKNTPIHNCNNVFEWEGQIIPPIAYILYNFLQSCLLDTWLQTDAKKES